jgi:hypothetical protein
MYGWMYRVIKIGLESGYISRDGGDEIIKIQKRQRKRKPTADSPKDP